MNAIPGFEYATVNGKIERPVKFPLVYHGSADIDPARLRAADGLPPGGDDIELIRHAEPPPGKPNRSAFRGACHWWRSPADDHTGAAFWARIDGWVCEIHNYPGYEVNQVLEGRIPDGRGGYRDPLMKGEQEIAIPARIPLSHIPRIGLVVGGRGLSINWQDT